MQHPGHLLRRAVQVLKQLWNEEVSHAITSPQFAVLNALYSEPNLDQRTLGQRVSLDRSTMTEVVLRLSTRGLIRTERDTRDGRRKTITLTPKGLSHRAAAHPPRARDDTPARAAARPETAR
jgi:MarR family transcriptional regulator, temperature-dependent positive regulator of motility